MIFCAMLSPIRMLSWMNHAFGLRAIISKYSATWAIQCWWLPGTACGSCLRWSAFSCTPDDRQPTLDQPVVDIAQRVPELASGLAFGSCSPSRLRACGSARRCKALLSCSRRHPSRYSGRRSRRG